MSKLLGISKTISIMTGMTVTRNDFNEVRCRSAGSPWINAAPILVLPIKERKLRNKIGVRSHRSSLIHSLLVKGTMLESLVDP